VNPNDIRFVDPKEAFAHALAIGALNKWPYSDFRADIWMYMHTTTDAHAFKNIITRRYLYVPLAAPQGGVVADTSRE